MSHWKGNFMHKENIHILLCSIIYTAETVFFFLAAILTRSAEYLSQVSVALITARLLNSWTWNHAQTEVLHKDMKSLNTIIGVLLCSFTKAACIWSSLNVTVIDQEMTQLTPFDPLQGVYFHENGGVWPEGDQKTR